MGKSVNVIILPLQVLICMIHLTLSLWTQRRRVSTGLILYHICVLE